MYKSYTVEIMDRLTRFITFCFAEWGQFSWTAEWPTSIDRVVKGDGRLCRCCEVKLTDTAPIWSMSIIPARISNTSAASRTPSTSATDCRALDFAGNVCWDELMRRVDGLNVPCEMPNGLTFVHYMLNIGLVIWDWWPSSVSMPSLYATKPIRST